MQPIELALGSIGLYCFVLKDETPLFAAKKSQSQNRKPKINKERAVMLIFGAALASTFLYVKRAPKRQLTGMLFRIDTDSYQLTTT